MEETPSDHPTMSTSSSGVGNYLSSTTSAPVNSAFLSTVKPPGSNDNWIIIVCAVGGFLLMAVLVIIILYCCKRKRRRRAAQKKEQRLSVVRPDMSINSALFDTGQLNPGLQLSDQDIASSLPSTIEKRRDTIVCEDVLPPPYDHDEEDDIRYNIHDVSIKLLTPWNDIYTKTESEEYLAMKNYIESSMKTIYASYDDFESVTLLQFRQGSLIADVQLKFNENAVEPLLPLECAVRSGKCANLVVDNNFFQIHRPDIGVINVFSEKILNRPEPEHEEEEEEEEEVLNQRHVITQKNGHTRRDLKGLKRESGYGSVEFDPTELQIKLEHQKKIRECSTKSTESRDSVTSEMGTSYSMSSKSLSSTNISIHSCADEEIHNLEHSSNRRKGLFSSLPRPGKRYDTGKSKQLASVLGEAHMALFDFKPQDYRELALKQGELVRVTYIDNGGWVKAMNEQNVQGWIPHNFVTPIDPENYNVIKRSVEVVSLIDDVVDPEIDNMLSANEDGDDDDENEGYYSVPRSLKSKPRHMEEDDEDGEESDLSSEDISGLFVIIFPFDPSEKNELKLEVGDLIDVLKTDETGWWKGRCLRTEDDGWFPSSYVKPYSLEMNVEIQEEDKGTVSDSEVHRRSTSVIKNQHKEEGGYSSDNGESRTMRPDPLRSKLNQPVVEKLNVPVEKQDVELAVSSNGVKLRPKRGPPKERAVSLIIDIDSGCGKVHFPAPLTPPPRLSAHRDHGNNNMFPDPPTKPVPPKPRTRHIEKTYRNLVAAGKLGSTDSLKTVSTECLVSLGRSPQKNGSWKRRRNSEDANHLTADIVRIRDFGTKPVSRTRPKSFQETPKNSFFYLANRYVNMKPACSLPSLVGDQVKLSPDDDRPFLDPIPRKAKSHSFRDDVPSLKEDLMPKRISSSMKDLLVIDPQDYRPVLEPIPRKSRKSKGKVETYGQPIKVPYENEKGYTVTKHENKHTVEVKPPSSLSSTKKSTNVADVDTSPTKPLPPEPVQHEALVTAKKPMVAPKPVLSSNSILSQLLNDHSIVPDVPLTRPPLISQKPTVPVRTTSKNFGAKKLIEEHRARQTNLPSNNSHTRGPLVGGRLRAQRHFSSFESINEEAEQASTPKDESFKQPTEHDHRRSRSEPHERILQTELNYVSSETSNHNEPFNSQQQSPSLATLPIHIMYDEKSQSLTYNSRASSLQSLNSVASSVRSTTSSKHEQANLRRAIMNVHGQGQNDLSFNVGAILYELRPKNKQGLCFGILEDSTQGWFPAESVEAFQQDQF